MDPLNQPNSFNGMDAYINAVNTENKHIAITDPNAVSQDHQSHALPLLPNCRGGTQRRRVVTSLTVR